MSMQAAVVRSFEEPPRYESYDTPQPRGTEQTVVDVLAAGLRPRVAPTPPGGITPARPVPLAEVEAAWRHPDPAGERTVLIPPARHLS
jgi:hypothetical protein